MLNLFSFTKNKIIDSKELDLSCLDIMVDMHSHILPGMDDGSDSLNTTKEMLKKIKSSGINYVVATPHFYAGEEYPERFLERREKAVQELQKLDADGTLPEVYLGAEVAFFEGINKSEKIKGLTLVGTNYILIEMPFYKWTSRMLDEIEELAINFSLTPIIAHVERYIWFQPKKMVEKLFGMDVLIQCNASAFTDKKIANKNFRLLNAGSVDLLGSDAHNLTTRTPDLKDGVVVLASKNYYDALDFISNRSSQIIQRATRIL